MIACVGSAVLDRVFRVASLPTGGGKFVADDYFEVGGGPAATAAVAAAVLGHDVDFIGLVGDDPIGQTIVDELTSYGVGCRHVVRMPRASSSFSMVLVDDQGERAIVNYQDRSVREGGGEVPSVDISSYDLVLADSRWPLGTATLLTAARRAGVATVLDADTTPDQLDPLVAVSDHVAFSEPGLQHYTGIGEPVAALREAARRHPGQMYVTLGSRGCHWLDDGELRHEPAFEVPVVDTTGAGDVFHGALAVALAEGRRGTGAVRFASAVAALKCTRKGGREGIPDRSSVDELLASLEGDVDGNHNRLPHL